MLPLSTEGLVRRRGTLIAPQDAMKPILVCILLAASMAGGCAIRARPPTVEITSAPVQIRAAPRVIFEGRPVYLFSGRWYYRGDDGNWYVYRTEPPALQRQRTFIQ